MRLSAPALALAVLAALALPGGAAAAGGPAPPQQGGAGASAPGGVVTYVAVAAGRGRTLVQRIRKDGGAVERTRAVPGSFGVAGVGYDGSTTGLSADGRTLVLAGAIRAYPPRRTPLVVLDGRSLRERARFTLNGFWSVDAVSPDGRRLYLIHTRAIAPTLAYEVRAYDLTRRRLDPEPVVDASEPDEKMQGLAAARAVSADGRWAYTLYDRGDQAPFIHALDTTARRAHCIDVPQLRGLDLSRVRLTVTHGGRTLQLADDTFTRALVDTRSFAVREPAAEPEPAAAARPAGTTGGGDGFPWVPVVVAAAVALAAAGLLAARRRRPRSAPTGG